ncbi:MAG: hypothetical protein P4K98_11580, partial [Bryobacteraceae bacterium]|nr:hypothetical protein [Bryobacteraceae bacterium]
AWLAFFRPVPGLAWFPASPMARAMGYILTLLRSFSNTALSDLLKPIESPARSGLQALFGSGYAGLGSGGIPGHELEAHFCSGAFSSRLKDASLSSMAMCSRAGARRQR